MAPFEHHFMNRKGTASHSSSLLSFPSSSLNSLPMSNNNVSFASVSSSSASGPSQPKSSNASRQPAKQRAPSTIYDWSISGPDESAPQSVSTAPVFSEGHYPCPCCDRAFPAATDLIKHAHKHGDGFLPRRPGAT